MAFTCIYHEAEGIPINAPAWEMVPDIHMSMVSPMPPFPYIAGAAGDLSGSGKDPARPTSA